MHPSAGREVELSLRMDVGYGLDVNGVTVVPQQVGDAPYVLISPNENVASRTHGETMPVPTSVTQVLGALNALGLTPDSATHQDDRPVCSGGFIMMPVLEFITEEKGSYVFKDLNSKHIL